MGGWVGMRVCGCVWVGGGVSAFAGLAEGHALSVSLGKP